jgi:membrane fusion protein (multidrug efflux system)
MKRQFIIMLVLVGLVLGAVFGWKSYAGLQMRQGMAAMVLPPVVVSTAQVETANWSPTIPAVGSLRALQGVNVTAQIAGQITELLFDSGATVAAGDLLVRQYTADDEARLAGLVAETRLAEMNFKRAQELVAKELISATDYDTRQTELQRARAAEANLRLIIEQKTIRAPFSGRLGIRKVDLGQFVEPGDTLVRLESFSQILVEFPVPQRLVGQLIVGQPLTVTTDAWPGEYFAGSIRALEPQVNRETRMMSVQGLIANVEERLVPGMFVRVAVELPALNNVLTVPQSAVTYSPYGNSLFVVDDAEDGGQIVRNRFVVTGETRGDQVMIASGIEVGATIVTAGQQKLRNGSRVQIDNSVPVSNEPDPAPANN